MAISALMYLVATSVAHAQDTRPADLVASFESTAVRPILAAVASPQFYGGMSLGGTLRLGESAVLPIGGGIGITDRVEAGVDLGLGLRPLDPLERARLYGRLGLVPNRLAVQLGAWMPTEPGEHTGVEVLLPMRWTTDNLQLFGQVRSSASPGAQVWVYGTGATAAARVGGPVWAGLDLGFAQKRADGLASELLAGALHGSLQLGSRSLVRARWAFSDLSAASESGAWSGLSARAVELMVVRRLGSDE